MTDEEAVGAWRNRAQELWRVEHRVLQRALCELEGVPYEEPEPRWVLFAPSTPPPQVDCPYCPRKLASKVGRASHIRQAHPEGK